MAEITTIKTYMCSDGKVYNGLDEAEEHELWLETLQFVKERIRFQNPIDDVACCNEIAQMLVSCKDELAVLFGWRED